VFWVDLEERNPGKEVDGSNNQGGAGCVKGGKGAVSTADKNTRSILKATKEGCCRKDSRKPPVEAGSEELKVGLGWSNSS